MSNAPKPPLTNTQPSRLFILTHSPTHPTLPGVGGVIKQHVGLSLRRGWVNGVHSPRGIQPPVGEWVRAFNRGPANCG